MAERAILRNSQDLFLSIGAVIVVMMLIIPLPTVLLDVFMALNLLLSLLVLLTALSSKRAIDFSTFPTMLLILTVFGLGLNISSTRLILTQGQNFDGRMVKAFASFVVGMGNAQGLGIGLVIFIILIAVQAFVITKGATRVAEVAARFTLDAMPMKQAAVEAEYNSGALTEEEARLRKGEIQQEANFYGAMDGSTKFVSGNVKIGIFITIVNLVVGVIFGMVLRGEPIGQAIQTYAAFTIGDGLLAQLPSLLVSVATGIIVTRSASNNSLGSDIRKEFSQSAWIYYVGGGTLIVIGILPGFPWYVLIPMGVALIYLARRMQTLSITNAQKGAEAAKKKQTEQSASPSAVSPVVPLDPLSLELGYGLIPLVDKEKGAELLERITRIRTETGLDLGLVAPSIRIIDNMRLEPNEYSFKIRGIETGRCKIRMGWYMCLDTGSVIEEIQGEKTTDPAFGRPAIWVNETNREKAERSGYVAVDPPTIIATHLTEIIKTHAAEILDRQQVQSMIDTIKKDYPVVVEEVLSTHKFTVGEVQKVLQGLLSEQVSIRNLVAILETLADYGAITHKADILVEKVRQTLGKQICLQYCDEGHVLHVLRPAIEFEQKLIESRVETVNGPIAALDPAAMRSWGSALNTSLEAVQKAGYFPVILCSEESRILLKNMSRQLMPTLVILSIPEIASDFRVEIVGEIHVG